MRYLAILCTDGEPLGAVGMRAYGRAAAHETPNEQVEALSDIAPRSR